MLIKNIEFTDGLARVAAAWLRASALEIPIYDADWSHLDGWESRGDAIRRV